MIRQLAEATIQTILDKGIFEKLASRFYPHC
jgi:hypothetical protein